MKESHIQRDPIPIFSEDYYNVGVIEVHNEGFGKLHDPELSFKVLDAKQAETDANFTNLDISKRLTGAFDDLEIPIKDYISKKFLSELSEPVVCAMGTITYSTDLGERRRNRFRTRVSLRMPPPGAPAPPTYQYDVFLEAGKSGYAVEVPISQAIKPGDVDHFLLKMATEKYSSFAFDMKVESLSGYEFVKNSISATIFVPRSASKDVIRQRGRVERSHSAWANAYIQVNDLLPNYQDIKSGFATARVPIDNTFGHDSSGKAPPKKFILSYGKSVPVERVRKLIEILSPLGLEALDVDEKGEYGGESIYIGSYDYKGVPLTQVNLLQLSKLRPDSSEWISFIVTNRVKLAKE